MSSNDEIIKKLNDLKEEFLDNLYKDKVKAEKVRAQIKQVLQDAPDGTEMYRVVRDTSSGWTSHGSYSDTKATIKTLKKENGVWEMYGRKRDTLEDASASIVHNDGKLMNKVDAQAELEKQKVNDTSSHRDIVNLGTDKWGNPIGKSTNRVDYPNRKDENISSVDWEEEYSDLIWDEYAKRKAEQLGVSVDEVADYDEEGFDEGLYSEVAWELYNSGDWQPDPDMYMESKSNDVDNVLEFNEYFDMGESNIKDYAISVKPIGDGTYNIKIKYGAMIKYLINEEGYTESDARDEINNLYLNEEKIPANDKKDTKIDNIVKEAYYDLQLGDVREFKYNDHITFEIYKDTKYEDVFQIYTYLDNDLQYGFDTEDGVIYNNMKDELIKIVRELKGVIK